MELLAGAGADEVGGGAAGCEADAGEALSGLNILVNIWFGVGWQEGADWEGGVWTAETTGGV